MKIIIQRAAQIRAAATGETEKLIAELIAEKEQLSQKCIQVVDQRDKAQRELDAIVTLNDLAQKQQRDARPPHEALISLMDVDGVSAEALSLRLDYPLPTLHRFLKGRFKMTAKLAVKLASIGYGDARYWMDLQTTASLREEYAALDVNY